MAEIYQASKMPDSSLMADYLEERFDSIDLMAMEVLIGQEVDVDSIVEDFNIAEMNVDASDFDFLDNYQEVAMLPDAAPVKSPEQVREPLYFSIPAEDNAEAPAQVAEPEAPADVVEIPKFVILKPPLQIVAMESSEDEQEIDLRSDDVEEMSKAEITIPVIPTTWTKARLRKQIFKKHPANRQERPMFTPIVTTPKKKRKKSAAEVKRQLFPADEKENILPEDSSCAESPNVSTKIIIATRRSLRINNSARRVSNKEIYFSCDVCPKIFKERKMFEKHRKSHAAKSPQ
ncbi:uncharacterized protein LOC132264431 [Phlebotomus argentipes]|uniref:uncharacterized protein LOC132264431 n=1 Tax=Phlebotomus argentipes TaxID=94469 RepID=UPI0028930FD4|nr:uncharacterized protein LOC132264431 [Phlebotomus argentipes]XP_059620629.1 uncharacterized protein LOC132264431 [Phlebotomus argentipes]